MPRATEKFLIETSAVRPALGDSTARQCAHFQEQVRGGTLHTSGYIRMEFLRRWFCDTVGVALLLDRCANVSEALCLAEQDFRPRRIKGVLAVIEKYLREVGPLASGSAAAKEVGRLALRWLRCFDKVFPARIKNRCRCQIGSLTPQVTGIRLLEDLQAFRDAFLTPVTDCEVNAFLGFAAAEGRAAALLADKRVAALPVGKKLRALHDASTWVTCRECVTIGDVVIALEQPASCCLVHLDNAFNDLCRARGHPHRQIQSVVAVERERPEGDNA
jgi:hypothetical protein